MTCSEIQEDYENQLRVIEAQLTLAVEALEIVVRKTSVQTRIELDGSRSSPVDASFLRVVAREALDAINKEAQ